MSKKNNQSQFALHLSIANIFYGVAFFLMFFFVIVGEFVYPNERDAMHTNCRLFEADWQQVLEDGSRVAVEVPGKVPAEWGEVITLVTTVPDNVTDGDTIFFRPVWQDVDIYVDGELRQHYSTRDSRPFGDNSAFRYVYLELNESDAGKEITYQFSSESKYAGTMRASYIGDKMSVWLHLLNGSGLRTVIAVFLALMSLFCIIVCVILKVVYKKILPLNYIAWTIFLCALWVLSEIDFRQLLVNNISVLTNCTYWTLMLIPLPLTIYIDVIQEHRYKEIFVVPIFYSIAITVIGTFLQVFDIVQFVQQLPFIHAGIAIAIICVILTIFIDVFKKKIGDYLAVGIGVFGLMLTAIVEIMFYYYDVRLSLGTVLLVGLVFLLIMAIIKTAQDLLRSERKKQQAITAREAQAKFLANMSHEIRTPINAVLGMNEMILRENDDEIVQEYARNIQSASTMLLGLVNDILDFSKIESGQLELVEDTYSLAPLIQDESLLLNTRIIGKHISTHIEVDPYIPSKFWGDELRIKQVITNLLSNAVKYTQEGSVTLKAYFKWIDADNVELCFSVIDTGVGIKKEDLAELFDSFKRFEINKNRNIEGTGLGLNIAKQLVDLMNGTITVESVYGKGSTFTIAIPQKIMDKTPIGNIHISSKEKGKPAKTTEAFLQAPEAKMLVVDDNSMNLAVMRGLLKRTKIELDLAGSGRECLELTKHKKYHIIMMDHMMPEMDGVETLHALRADVANPNQNTTVIALTANAIAGCREMYLEYGFNDYMSKPIQAEKLEELLVQHLPKRLVHRPGESEEAAEALGQTVATLKNENTSGRADRFVDLLFINRELGLSYSLDSEEIYRDVLQAFCEQGEEYLPLLADHFANQNWSEYAMIVHALKGNTLNIGAEDFSKLSLQHELAAKKEDADYIKKEYANYIETLQKLIKKVKKML